MDFGIFLAPAADSWKIVKRAEELGFGRAWFYDTQLLNADTCSSRWRPPPCGRPRSGSPPAS